MVKQARLMLGIVVSLITILTYTALTLAAVYFYPDVREKVNVSAIALYHEARGEPLFGTIGVMNVIWNRAYDSRFPNSIEKVIKQKKTNGACKYHFSFWCEKNLKDPRTLSFQKMKLVAFGVLIARFTLRSIADNTNGALFYYNPKGVKVSPCWATKETFAGKVKNHIFHKAMPWEVRKKMTGRCRIG